MPLKDIIDNTLPATNTRGKEIYGDKWQDLQIGELLRYLGLRIYQLVNQLPYVKWFWEECQNDAFPAHNLGRFMPRSRFESITAALTLAEKEDDEEEILSFIEVVNESFQKTITPSRA